MRLVSPTGVIAAALAIGAIATSSAQADVPLRAGHQQATSVPYSYSHQATTPPVVPPTPNPLIAGLTPWPLTPNPDQQSTPAAVSTPRHLICNPRARSCQPATTRVVSTAQNEPGFQYDDAAIGASVMVGLGTLGIAGALAIRRRNRLPHP
jgi:hypothetical protein